MKLIKAFLLCMVKHWKQKDKAGKRYVWHPIHVMINVKGYNEKIVALLHDIVEDTEVTVPDLKNLKFSKEVIEAVDVITKKKDQEYFSYLKSIRDNSIAKKVKIEDLKHNSDLKRLRSITQKDIDRAVKYKKAIDYLSS
jgi:putative GTP diphosphokinase